MNKNIEEFENGEIVWVRWWRMGVWDGWAKCQVVSWTWWRDDPKVHYQLHVLGWGQEVREECRHDGERHWCFENQPRPFVDEDTPTWPEPCTWLMAQPQSMVHDRDFVHYGQEEEETT